MMPESLAAIAEEIRPKPEFRRALIPDSLTGEGKGIGF